MKYKLINLETKEEHICDKVTIGYVDYYFTNQLPELGDVVYNCISKKIYKITIQEEIVNYEFPVICSTNPSFDIPQVVDEVKIVSKEHFQHKIVGSTWYEVFEEGYNIAKEEYGNSDDDMVEFAWWLKENLGRFSCDRTAHFKGEYFKLWKEQHPKTIYYK